MNITILPPTARANHSPRKWLSISMIASSEAAKYRKEAKKHLPKPKSRL